MSDTTLELRLTGAPAAFLEPARAPSLTEARAWCKALAESHYENFHVATWFLPPSLRPHFHAIYAYCRVADDLSDEVGDPLLALRLLKEWEQMLDEVYHAPERVRHPVFVALADTIAACEIPQRPFSHLLVSFRRDQSYLSYNSLEELVAYSDSSANPVGHLVLYASGYREERLFVLSDKICTALQLANMWQDVGNDLAERGRIYLPADEMERFGVTRDQLAARKFTPAYRELLRYLVGRTRSMLAEGAAIEDRVDADLAITLRLFRRGGESILDAIEAAEFDTLSQRPYVSKAAKARLLLGALASKLRVPLTGNRKKGSAL